MRPRETMPLWVWLTFGLIAVCMATYLGSYLMIEDFILKK
jgi:hypothetical protein